MNAKRFAGSSKARHVYLGREIVLEFVLQRLLEMRVTITDQVASGRGVELIARLSELAQSKIGCRRSFSLGQLLVAVP
ncbi:hypothetical protein D3C72_2486840 [compost metagenome]